MFRKIVSNLAFSPALVGQLGFYARRLKREETTRRLGLLFTAFALIVQSLTVFTPPESANAASGSDMIRGGVNSKAGILAAYDNPRSDFKEIMDYNGITRANLASMSSGNLNSRSNGTDGNAWKSWSRNHLWSASQGEVKYVVPLDGNKGSSTVYSRPLWRWDSTSYTKQNGSTYPVFWGDSSRGKFAIMKDCGNLVVANTPKPNVGGQFIAATCDTIRGKATDGRDKNARVKVFLYFGGPPGKGTKSEPIMTTTDGTFSVKVPETYRKAASATRVWGVMVPLPGWHDSTVQFSKTATIPGGCVKAKPVAACSDLTFTRISRTDFKLAASASVDNGAKLSSYTFSVRNADGTVVAEETVATSRQQAISKQLSITAPGSYTARVVVATSEGNKTGETCETTFKVQAPATPAVEISKKVDGVESKQVDVNQPFDYQVTVTNTGEVDLKKVALSDPAPQGVTLQSATVGTIKNNAWSYTIPALAKGQKLTFAIKGVVKTYVAGSLKNTACVNAVEVSPGAPTAPDDCDDATITVPPPEPSLQVCELASKKVITIKQSQYDKNKHSKNLDDCKDACANNNPECIAVTESKTGKNLTSDVDAETTVARASDRIEYTLYIENVGKLPVTRPVTEELADVLEYSKLTQTGGGTYDDTTKVLSWTSVTLQPGEKTSRSFVVQVLGTIPDTAKGQSDPSSYDCVMTNAFGNTVDIAVDCQAPKVVEATVNDLPKTGPGANLLFAGIVGSVVTFFWARSRQLGREVRLIRKDFNMGTI